MPKAFTYFCENVNLSLFDDTLTFYEKPRVLSYNLVTDKILDITLKYESIQLNDFFDNHDKELGLYCYVQREHNDHDRYHQDIYDKNNPHRHVKFNQTIDVQKLDQILKILVKYNVISSNEQTNIMQAFKEAPAYQKTEASVSKMSFLNAPNRQGSQNIPSDKKPAPQEKTDDGLRRGFFL